MIQTAAVITAGLVFMIGLYGMLTKRDMIKICISISIMDSAIVMALVAAAFVPDGAAPILDDAVNPAGLFADPLPHALALTAIVIGAGILAIALALTVSMYRHFGTTDIVQVFTKTRIDYFEPRSHE
ncbi:sodium:proton antiporter [Spirochaeta africana]|uniref:Multisubunit Na+/H+ antiporter, MnhC subunit n=1 Tax=Spirochaeta africana (strain ATCC 700263 / DSM 8902 / Z-7692) TaxID=889378 RepID=H9ULG5_SPIAZ|nr:cation:proton antiporter subunit C [Spirochaeta africana]AFG38358.1 multisubunit Na+/H+ antiporter, MnhC subunit [Spirochaeta africana DSM 8902]